MMSRSYRKTPVIPITTSDSEKKDKRLANRKLRRTVKTMMVSDSRRELPTQREISNIECFNKDGKQRFNAKEHPDWMRK